MAGFNTNRDIQYYGYEIKRSKKVENDLKKRESFASPDYTDGAITIESGLHSGYGFYGQYVDFGTQFKNERDLIKKYRDLIAIPEVDSAIEDIINESITTNDHESPVELNLDMLQQPDNIKKAIEEEWEYICKILKLKTRGYEIFRRWYVDSKVYFHKVIDPSSPKKGIRELRPIDALKMRKVREIIKRPADQSQVEVIEEINEYYIYSDSEDFKNGVRISPDSIAFCPSGLYDTEKKINLGYLYKAIKPANQLRMMEDAVVIYRIARAPERRIFYIDVGSLPKNKAEEYVKNIMTRYRNKMVYDATTGELRDDKRHMSMLEDFWMPRREGCFSLDTKIKLLDGRDIELGQLIVEHKLGKTNWVYSVSPDGTVVPGKISWAGVTRNDAKVIDVHLDNGEVVTCTPDHKFILRNGVKIEAQNLQVGTSLMPLNMRDKDITHNRNGVYPQIQDNKTGKWKFVHRMVSEYIHGERKLNEVVHHKDFTRVNNNPENLEYMDKIEHFKYHSKMGTNAWKNGNVKQHKIKLSKSGKAFFQTEKGMKRRKAISDFNKTCEKIWDSLRIGREKIKEQREYDKKIMTHEDYLSKWSSGLSLEASHKGGKSWKKIIEDDRKNLTEKEFYEKYILPKKKISKEIYDNKVSNIELAVLKDIITDSILDDINTSNKTLVKNIQQKYPEMTLKKLRTYLYHNGYDSISELIHRTLGEKYTSKKRLVQIQEKSNHTVIKIVERSDRIDVGTLTIDEHHEHHDYHNFALSAGIFVMNSQGTQIDTLNGGQNLGEMEDVLYFQKKLYKALNVPISRLETETGFNIGRSSEITRDELKFSKFIDRLRTKFSELFYDILKTQLVLKGVITVEDWDNMKYDIIFDFKRDSHFTELKELELLQERTNIYNNLQQVVGRYFSHEWARKNIFQMNDDEIKEEDKIIKAEQKNKILNPPEEVMEEFNLDIEDESDAEDSI